MSQANAKGNAQQRCMFESTVKQNQSPDGARRLMAKYLVFYLYSPAGVTCLAVPTPYRLEIANFSYPPLIWRLRSGWLVSNLWKSFMVPETRVFQASNMKIWWFELAPFLTDAPVWWTDRQTDRRMDRIAMAKMRYCSSCCCT